MASRSSHEYIGDTQTNHINNMMNREQKLKYLKNDLLLCHSLNEYDQKYDQNIERLKECVSNQEIKLRQLRALKAQVNKHTNNNAIIHSELESIRSVFNEKEKELAVALTKVDSLTRQLEELRKGNITNSYQISEISNGKHATELEKLRQELLYRSKLTEQHNQEILHKKGLLTQRQSEMVHIDKRIVELQQRLARKRQLNQHLMQMHYSGNGVYGGNVILRSSVNVNAGHSLKSIHSRPLSANIAAVEPLQREQNRINENDDVSKNQDFSGCKSDPKYQTLPYNTKFNLRQLQRMNENHLMETKLEASKNEFELASNEIYAINNNLIKNMANNAYNGSEQINGNNSNSKLINLKQPYMEERPSPSGSSGSSDRASIQNHNSSAFYKMQSSIVNSNFANQQKIFNAPYLENDNLKHSKSVNLINSRNMQNSNQNLSHNYRVPTVSQTQSYIASNLTKVPHLTLNKLKPILPPKPSIPVKPIPPPRQTPNHSINAQSENHDSVDNSFSFYETNTNINNFARKTANLLKTNATTHTLNQNYGCPLGIQKGIDSSDELLIQRSLSNKQQSNVFEDKTCLNSFNADFGNETTDGCNINGQSIIGCDTNSSTSSLSSISVTNSGNNDNNVRSNNSNINNITQTACADKENFSNANKSFNSNANDLLRNINNNNSNQSNKSCGLNNLMLDWHKVKRRPFIADNKLEQELAIHSTIPNSFVDNNKLMPQFDLNSDCQSSSVNEDNSTDCETFKNKPEEISKVELNAKFIQEPRDMNMDRFSDDNNKENLCDKEQNNEELSCLPPKCIGGVKRTKGNLKSQQIKIGDHIGISRRVSFDPLALLLDAALEGELELVKKTAAEVPNASAANDEGITALHNSICAGHSDIVNYLVENGCDVNAQDSDGWTPLHCAASCNNLAMVKFLVEHGACIFATTLSDQETAAEKCEEDEEGFDGCSQYLYGIQEKLGIMNSGVVYAVYDYDSQNADELSFKEGDKIIILRKGDDQEREWWWSKLKDREGYIPRNLIGLYPRVRGEKRKSFSEEQNE